MVYNTPKDAMPWVGLYAAMASLICTLAMAVDVFQGFRQRKLWFPCRFFTINAASITLIAIALKLPVDLSTHILPGDSANPKKISIIFLVTMLANFLPSLALMDDKELLLNIIAIGILLITITVNVFIQTVTNIYFSITQETLMFMIISLPWPFSVALTVSASRRILEHQYKKLYKLASNSQEIKFTFKELMHHVKRCWMMAETGNPQFVIACSPISSASGVICAVFVFYSIVVMIFLLQGYNGYEASDYKWSIKVIVIVQLIGVIIGSIAPIFRCMTAISYFNLSKKWSMNYLNMLKVERYWTQRLQQWKHTHVCSYIPGHRCIKVFNIIKNMTLNVCITLQIAVVVICKTMCLIPRFLLILVSCCVNHYNSFFKRKSNESSNNMRLEIEEYASYVLQVEEEAKLLKRLLRNALTTINRLLQEYEKEEPINLIKLLEKSTGFRGVVEFDDNQVPSLHAEETHNCWSLVTVTLTTIALALPNIAYGHFKELLFSMKEGLHYVNHIEEILNSNEDLENTRKAARHVWIEVEVYRKWLEIDVQKKALEGKTSKEIIQWLGDESVKIVINFKRCKQ